MVCFVYWCISHVSLCWVTISNTHKLKERTTLLTVLVHNQWTPKHRHHDRKNSGTKLFSWGKPGNRPWEECQRERGKEPDRHQGQPHDHQDKCKSVVYQTLGASQSQSSWNSILTILLVFSSLKFPNLHLNSSIIQNLCIHMHTHIPTCTHVCKHPHTHQIEYGFMRCPEVWFTAWKFDSLHRDFIRVQIHNVSFHFSLGLPNLPTIWPYMGLERLSLTHQVFS